MTRFAGCKFILIPFVLGLCAAPASMCAPTVSHPAAEAPRPTRTAALIESGYAHGEWLADPAWLQAHLHDSNVKVIALMGSSEFKSGHIPGAMQIDWPELGLADTSDPSIAHWRADIEERLSRLGISQSDTVLIYDDGTLYAPRLWWILDQLGHRDKRILNGGLVAWTNARGKIEKGTFPNHRHTEAYKGAPNAAALATLNDVKAALDDPSVVLVDARTPAEYAKGHIPGAINIPFTDNAVATRPKVWKSAQELRAMYQSA
ncbi:MAG TPA: rhodanese-like domain-containing protein, partial [Burkholderiales bacterium]|nr:rhodanese-like domain-containing protein [Burkholderiales bacterium]